MSHEDMRTLLLALTAEDPDSQDIYMAYGNENVFLDGSGRPRGLPLLSLHFVQHVPYRVIVYLHGTNRAEFLASKALYAFASVNLRDVACAFF